MSVKSLKASRKGFTLIEIMIVVLIIGILLAIAVPNFIRARESSRTKSCVANLKQIDSAKEQYAMDSKLTTGATVNSSDLTATNGYLKSWPACPSNGTYTIGAVSTNPACSLSTQASPNAHVLP